MTCFWNGILESLYINDIEMIKFYNKPNIKELINYLKNNNKLVLNVVWNNFILSNKELYENKISIDNYDINTRNNGYLCSTCDPFLLLVSELFQVDIIHKYNGIEIIYKNIKNLNKKIFNFESNINHFWKK
jgi:hypothetical protein